MNRKTVLSFVGLCVVVFLWGIAPVVSKYLFDNEFYSPALLVAARGLLSCIAMLIYVLITRGFKEVNKKYWICVPAGIFLGCAYLFQFIGLESTTPAKNTFLESLSCVAVPICMFIFVREKPSIASVASAIACLIGSFVLCGDGWDFSAMFTSPTMGDILSAIGGIFFGIDIAFTKVYAKGKNAWVYVFFQLIILTIMSFAYAIPFEKNLAFSWNILNLLLLLFLGILCTAVCWVLRTICIRNVSAVTCAVLMPMAAVIATLASIIFSMEKFSWNVVVGGIIITLAIILSGLYDAWVEKKELQMKLEKQKEIELEEKSKVGSITVEVDGEEIDIVNINPEPEAAATDEANPAETSSTLTTSTTTATSAKEDSAKKESAKAIPAKEDSDDEDSDEEDGETRATEVRPGEVHSTDSSDTSSSETSSTEDDEDEEDEEEEDDDDDDDDDDN